MTGSVDEDNEKGNYIVYRQRYFLLASLIIVNISNAVTWINLSIVATTAGAYYEKSVEAINLFAMLFYIMSIPFTVIAPYVVSRYGLWHAMHIGSGLNCLGSVLKAVGTSSLFDDINTQYAVSIFGQAVASVAQGFVLFTPTKLSQLWFPQKERALATSTTSLANAFGIVVAAGLTPIIVQSSNDIPLNNTIWAVLAVVCEVFTLAFVTRGKPKSPPSKSADHSNSINMPFFVQLKQALQCRSFLILMNTLGIAVALFSSLSTLTQQMLCPLGYTEQFSGLVLVVLIMSGIGGSILFSIFIGRMKYFGELVVVMFSVGCLMAISLLEFYLIPDMQAFILISAALLGVFSVGSFPPGLELAVEFTYPVEETISTAFVYLIAQIEGLLLVIIIPILATEPKRENFTRNACTGSELTDAKDYSIPAMVMIGIYSTVICVMLLFMKIVYKRRNVDDHSLNESTLTLHKKDAITESN